MRDEETYIVEGEVLKVTDKAIGLRVEGYEDVVWIPKSQVVHGDDEPDEGDIAEIEIPMWLAESKGLA